MSIDCPPFFRVLFSVPPPPHTSLVQAISFPNQSFSGTSKHGIGTENATFRAGVWGGRGRHTRNKHLPKDSARILVGSGQHAIDDREIKICVIRVCVPHSLHKSLSSFLSFSLFQGGPGSVASVRLRFMHGAVRAVPALSLDGSSKEGFCVCVCSNIVATKGNCSSSCFSSWKMALTVPPFVWCCHRHALPKHKQRPNRPKLSEKSPEVVCMGHFRTCLRLFWTCFRHCVNGSLCLGSPTICPLQVWRWQVVALSGWLNNTSPSLLIFVLECSGN